MTLTGEPGSAPTNTYGCCTDSGECGIDLGMAIPGQSGSCVPRTFLCNFVPKAQVSMIQPMTCDGEPMDLPADCGSNRSGFPGRGGPPPMSSGNAGMSGGASGSGN